MHRTLVSLSLVLTACGSAPEPDATPEPSAEAPVSPAEPVEVVPLDDWGREEIALPPEFAPGMPAGNELLLFAPGMFTDGAEDYWSYVFLMRVELGGLDVDGVTELFEQYYDGLIGAVGGSRGLDLPDDPATARFERREDGVFVGEVDLIDAFVTGEPLTVHVDVRPDTIGADASVLRVLASPQPRDHVVWARLRHAVGTLDF